jgi:hypothetical protein
MTGNATEPRRQHREVVGDEEVETYNALSPRRDDSPLRDGGDPGGMR